MFRTRQAPSPTGYLHFGTARTMLFTQLLANKNQGIWFLRLEDTDRARLNADSVGSLLASMQSLGLVPDEGVNNRGLGIIDDYYKVYQAGDFGPYIQSERLAFYHKYAQELIDKKLAYWSFLKEEHKQELQEFKKITKKPINYLQANLQLLAQEPLTQASVSNDQASPKLYQSVLEGLLDELKPDLRFAIQTNKKIVAIDQLLGSTEFNLALEEDFTIIKSDGYPTYHLAHAVDDYLMQTSLIIRTQEWFSSLPKHYELTKALIGKTFEYMHFPPIMAEVGNKKMSKRDGNVNVQTYLEEGYLPEAIVNYLYFLGYNPGLSKELYLETPDFTLSLQDRVKLLHQRLLVDFDIAKLTKSPARFGLSKLQWFNQNYLKMLSNQEFRTLNNSTSFGLESLIDQERQILVQKELSGALELTTNYKQLDVERIVFKDQTVVQAKQNLATILPFVKELLTKYEPKKQELASLLHQPGVLDIYCKMYKELESDFKNYLKEQELQFGPYLYPLRKALSGQDQSPSPFEMMIVLDKEVVLKRINYYL
jgi:glutamyl-tRNA synthetase